MGGGGGGETQPGIGPMTAPISANQKGLCQKETTRLKMIVLIHKDDCFDT